MADKYKKKPVEIEAKQFRRNAFDVCDWADDTYLVPQGCEHAMRHEHEYDRGNGHILENAPAFLVVKTLEGNHRADEGDWIIKGVQGEFYPCKPDIFEATYDKVVD